MPVSVPYTGGGALDDSDSESGSDNNDEDDVNGSEGARKVIPVGDGRRRIKFGETRRISSFMESSLAKRRISSFTTDTRSSTSLPNLHASSSFSPSPHTTSYAPRIPSPTSDSHSHFSPAIRKGQPSSSPLSTSTVKLGEGSPDSHLASNKCSNGAYDDEDEHGDSNTHSGSNTKSGSGSGSESGGRSPPASRILVRSRESWSSIRTVTNRPPSPRSTAEALTAVAGVEGSSTRKPSAQPRAVSGLGLSKMGPVAIEEPTVINVRRRVTDFAEMEDVQMCALLAIVAPKELGIGPIRGARFVDAYVEMLSRLQLHVLVAHVRKNSKVTMATHGHQRLPERRWADHHIINRRNQLSPKIELCQLE
ncbi:hypothetical protein BU17DRAFT_79634 [Hysterangium stoloniferum]|nr:hypothetical protein BU17DRAFT_79634 [Hysterangium stoloniferum]